MNETTEFKIKESEFRKITQMTYDMCKLNLHDGKKTLVQARLSKRLRKLGVKNFKDYIELVERDEEEFRTMIDVLTTNHTLFFREEEHFEFLKSPLIEDFMTRDKRKMRLWSAGCSSGEEPYTMAMLLRDGIGDIDGRDVLILATDISTRMLERAKEGVYSESALKKVPPMFRLEYFEKKNMNGDNFYAVKNNLKRLVKFRYLNLMDRWPMKGQFDVILCRNVMIYFDKKTQEDLINRFYGLLAPDGVLMIGHCESLAGLSHGFSFEKATIYRKPR